MSFHHEEKYSFFSPGFPPFDLNTGPKICWRLNFESVLKNFCLGKRIAVFDENGRIIEKIKSCF